MNFEDKIIQFQIIKSPQAEILSLYGMGESGLIYQYLKSAGEWEKITIGNPQLEFKAPF